MENGTIDITNVVTKTKEVWIQWAVGLVGVAARGTPVLSWLNLPVVSQVFDFLLTKIITLIANALVMEAFFLNTAIRKASQAQDFVSAVDAKNALPPTASNEEYENAEKVQMVAFHNFVMVAN